MAMNAFLIVFLGAGVGGALRHAVNIGCARLCGAAFPWGTLTVNVLGSLAMGLLAGWLALKSGEGWTQDARLFLATGVLGGFTTFSSFSLEAVMMIERRAYALAAAYIFGSVCFGLLGLMLGLLIMRRLPA